MPAVASTSAAPRYVLKGDSLHVVYGVLSLELGGIERLVCELAAEHSRRGHQTTVICVQRRGRLAEVVEAAGGEVWSLNKPPGRSAATIHQAAELLQEIAPSVLHTHQTGALWYLGKAAEQLGLPVVHTEHTDHLGHARSWLERLRVWIRWRRAAPLAQSQCCVSADVARSMSRSTTIAVDRIQVVPNGIDLSLYRGADGEASIRPSLGIPSGALVIGTVGRLAEVKRHDLLLQAFAALIAGNRHERTWLLVVGDGPERNRLERLAASLSISRRVVFAGYQAQPQRFYQAMDLFALTSRHEGLPLALLEAWASGLPVVSSAVGGIPQAVKHGVSGLLFESGDVKALEETFEGLLESPSWMKQLATAGRREVSERYSLAGMADAYEGFYRQLTRDAARATP